MMSTKTTQVLPYTESTKFNKPEIEEQQNKLTLRQIFEKIISSKYGKYLELLSTFFSVFSCLVYVFSTYLSSGLEWFNYVDIVIILIYIIEYFLKFFAAQHRMHFLFDTYSLVDLFTITPIFFFNFTDENTKTYIAISRIMRILRVVQIVNKLIKIGETEVSQQIFKIILTIFTLIFVFAGVMDAIERPYREELYLQQLQQYYGHPCDGNPTVSRTSFHEMVYFVVVTLATVGYGDIVPVSEMGRLCVIILIIIALVLIPKQTNELIRLMGLQSPYARATYKTNAEVPHLIISGHVSVAALRNFCNELFHPDHGYQDKNAVILQQYLPSVEMESFLHNPLYEMFLTYLQGNPMLDKDLHRAVATKAKTCVLLNNKYASDSHSADHKNILTGLSIKKYVHHQTGGENVRLVMQLIKPENKTHYYSSLNMKSNDQFIVVEEIKMNLMAKSCFSPGIISMLSNLIASAGDQANEDHNQDWLKEYTSGMGHEIYRTELSPKFKNKKFSEVAATVYNAFSAILFGIELEVAGQTIIRLNPGNYIIPDSLNNKIYVYMICEDKKVADQVTEYEMTNEEMANLHQQITHKNQKSLSKMDKKDFNTDYNEITTEDELLSVDSDHLNHGQGSVEDNDLLETDYYLSKEPANLMQVTMISIQDNRTVNNHIVVCGIHPSIYYFLLPLRARYLKEYQYVVILSPEPPSTEIWECISRFPRIIYIKGSPLNSEDLLRANINYADKAVVLGHDTSKDKDDVLNDEMLDAESIFIYKAIKKCNKNIQIMIELVYSSNIEFLLPKGDKKQKKRENDFKYDLSPLYAAGEVYISAIIDTLTCQSYYNPHLVTILQQILTGGKQSNAVIRGICDHAELKQSNLWQISVPEDYLNKTFGELFNYLASERDLIALGLYRLPGATDNHYPYVYTNPDVATKLTHRDKVFVLASNMPNDLLSGFTDNKNIPGDLSQNNMPPLINYGTFADDIKDDKSGPDNTYGIKKNPTIELNKSKNDNEKSKLVRTKSLSPDVNNNGDPNQIQTQMKKLGKNMQASEMENLNPNSATYAVLEQVNNCISNMHAEINQIKRNLTIQDEQIIEKVRNALRQELSNLGRR